MWPRDDMMNNMLLLKDGFANSWVKGVRIFPGDNNDALETHFVIRKLLDINLTNRYDLVLDLVTIAF